MNIISTGTAVQSLQPEARFVIENGVITKWLNPAVPQPTEAEIAAELTRLREQQPWVEFREKRNQLLTETDYLALNDVTMSDEMQTYRQALRDLPANTSDPANPVWPTKPGG